MQTIISSDDIPERRKLLRKPYVRMCMVILVGVMLFLFHNESTLSSVTTSVVHADQNTASQFICQLHTRLEMVAPASSAKVTSNMLSECEDELKLHVDTRVTLVEPVPASSSIQSPSSISTSGTEAAIGSVEEETAPAFDAINKKAQEVVAGYPIAHMLTAMSTLDNETEAFLIGIAKKESNWGKRAPHKSGSDCYNYWGYKGSAGRGSSLGYACFASPEEAVKIVGAKLEKYVVHQRKNTASKMLVWKCGSSCAGHDPAGVASWVNTVDTYRKKVL